MKRVLKKSSVLIISAIIAFAGCANKSDIYTIIGGSNNESMGIVTGDGNYHDGDVATLVAEPKPGYHFAFWADGKRKNPRTFTVTKNMVVMAIFGIGERPNNGGGDDEEDIVNPDSLAISLSGTISESLTLEDRGLDVDYIVYDKLVIGGNANVTIEPGVTIRFLNFLGDITVCDNASLNIAGTAPKPVVFIGKTDDIDTGSWHGIELNTTSTNNNWEHATFKNGGSGSVVSIRKGSVSMKSCIINGSEGNGLDVWEDGRVSLIEDCIFQNCKQYPILFSNNVNFNALGDKNDFFSNGENFIWSNKKEFGGDEEYVIRKMTVPYLFSEGIDISGNAKFTIEPGVKILMGLETKFVVGKDVLFKAVGTADEPISVRGDEDVAGYWDMLRLETANKNSIMEHCFITGAGMEPPGFDCALLIGDYCAITMRNCSFTKVGSDFGATVFSAENFAKNFKFENITFKDAAYKNASEVYVSVGYGIVESGSIFDSLDYLADMLK